MEKLDLFIVHAHNQSKLTDIANIVLATSTFAEIDGTYTNFECRVQHFEPAVVTVDNLRIMGMKMSRLDKFGSDNDRWTTNEKRNCRPLWRIIQQIANLFQAGWQYNNTEEIFDEIAENIESFKGMSYELLDEYQGLKLWKSQQPEAKVINYESHYMKPN